MVTLNQKTDNYQKQLKQKNEKEYDSIHRGVELVAPKYQHRRPAVSKTHRDVVESVLMKPPPPENVAGEYLTYI